MERVAAQERPAITNRQHLCDLRQPGATMHQTAVVVRRRLCGLPPDGAVTARCDACHLG
jgi:hypothetical protein